MASTADARGANTAANIVEVRDLRTYFATDDGMLKAVDGVSFSIAPHRTLAVIGESGCGKSVTARSLMRIVPKPGRIVSGQLLFRRPTDSKNDAQSLPTVDLAQLPANGDAIRRIRGRDIAMIFQEPMTSLSPVHSVGNQIMEALLLHRTRDKREARAIAIDMLARVGIANPSHRIDEYPHQLSGGMRQRVMIAMALCCHPALLIADEPTTALDVTVQAQIIELMKRLQAEEGTAIQYITHDLGVVAEVADEVIVMYLGRVVESGSVRQIFHNPLHPYTRRLLDSTPRLGSRHRRLEAIPGTVSVPLDPPPRCGFVDRCTLSMAGKCDAAIPALVEMEAGHSVRCFLHGDAIESPVDIAEVA
ncbi:MAG TPA: ABC transporter ATP-binding protein [Devosiaceae bacterium]|jgi:oligopeptide/dipeptide ABC transporter ATP-binding protein